MIIALQCIILISIFFSLPAIDNVHFYRPSFFWGEPRLEWPYLTSIDIAVGTGKTKKGYDSKGRKTALLNIYGLQNMHNLADNVPNLNPSDPLDAILINLNALKEQKNFGALKLKGRFHIIESAIDIYQNIINGFFFELYIPARKLTIDPALESQNALRRVDTSPNGTGGFNKQTPEWRAFLDNFFSILRHHNITVRRSERAGIGDVSLLAGWACSYQNTVYLDFIDVAAKIGVLLPTAPKQSISNPFELPLGYDGHWGVPLKFDLSIGLWEWFTSGIHIGSLFLADRTKQVRMNTSTKQNGFIKLAYDKAKVDPGIYFDFDIFAKADHICKGLSILLAYAFNFKERDSIEPENSNFFNKKIVTKDPLFAGWNQQVFQLIVEYDFAKKISDIGTRIALFYNRVLDGKRVFNTHMKGGSIGIDIAWCF